MELLLLHGADAEVKNEDGETPKMMMEAFDNDSDEEDARRYQEILILLAQHVKGKSQTKTSSFLLLYNILYCVICCETKLVENINNKIQNALKL